MTDEELNKAIAALADDERYQPEGLGGGKAVPYYGWFWRNVDFSAVRLAKADRDGWDVPEWVGFCVRNKWDYPDAAATNSAEIRAAAVAFVRKPSKKTATALFGTVQRG